MALDVFAVPSLHKPMKLFSIVPEGYMLREQAEILVQETMSTVWVKDQLTIWDLLLV